MKKIIAACGFVVTFGVILFALKPDFTPMKKAISGLFDTQVRAENQVLREKVTTLQQQISKIQVLERENNDLKVLLNTNFSKEYKKTYATVVSQSIANDIFVSLDKGTKDGIKEGNVVVFGSSLLGRITKVYDTYCNFVPITAPESSAGALLSRTGALGYTESSRQGFFENTLSLTLFGAGDFAAAGDKIITSGLGSVFPKGLIIGSVIDSTTKEKAAKLRTEDMFRLHTVCILSEAGR